LGKTIGYFEEIYGKRTIAAIFESCDGSKTMEEVAEAIKIPLDTLVYVAEQLVLAGLLEVKY